MKVSYLFILMILFQASTVYAQEIDGVSPDSLSKIEERTESNSLLYLSLSGNIVPHSPFSLTPVVGLNLGHFTADLRYNYEDIKTISASVGYRFFRDSDFWYQINPTIGVSAGNFDAISPALSVALGYGSFSFSVASQYSYSLDSSNQSDFFIWANIYYDISPFFYVGINAQRTKLFSTPNTIDAGIIVGFDPGPLDIFVQANNFWNSSRYFIVGASYFIDLGNKKHQAIEPSQQ